MGTKSLQVIDLEMHRGWGWGWAWARGGGSLCSFGGFQTLKASAGSSGTGSWLDVLAGLDQRGSHPVLQMQPVSSSNIRPAPLPQLSLLFLSETRGVFAARPACGCLG